jgi:hypothetical protein
MVLTFTLQSAYSGATYVAGPFDISGTTSGGVTTLLGDNISKAALLTGVTISNIDDATTGGTIQSVDGICSNSIQWTVSGGSGVSVIEAQANGSMEPCIGGTIDDYMGASVTLNNPVTVDTNFDVTVWYKDLGNECNFPNITTGANGQSFTVTVLAGETNGSINACLQGQNFTNGANICGACITGTDNTIDTITFIGAVGC